MPKPNNRKAKPAEENWIHAQKKMNSTPESAVISGNSLIQVRLESGEWEWVDVVDELGVKSRRLRKKGKIYVSDQQRRKADLESNPAFHGRRGKKSLS